MAEADSKAEARDEQAGDEAAGKPLVPDYFVPAATEVRLVTLQTMTPMEAELARVKLESEGVQCFAANSEAARINSLWNIPVRLQVREDELERAREILARAPENVAEGEYVEEDWRCPQCRKKAFDLLPLTPGRRWLRDAWVVMLLVTLASCVIPLDQVVALPGEVKMWGYFAWGVALVVIGAVVVMGKRGKRCRECGWTKQA